MNLTMIRVIANKMYRSKFVPTVAFARSAEVPGPEHASCRRKLGPDRLELQLVTFPTALFTTTRNNVSAITHDGAQRAI